MLISTLFTGFAKFNNDDSAAVEMPGLEVLIRPIEPPTSLDYPIKIKGQI